METLELEKQTATFTQAKRKLLEVMIEKGFSEEYERFESECLKRCPYRSLAPYLRHLIIKEIRSNRTSHLKRKAGRHMDKPFYDLQFKFTAIPKWPVKLGNGKRNLEIADDEIILYIYGLFNNENNHLEGMKFVEHTDHYRFVLGSLPAQFGEYGENLSSEFEAWSPVWMHMLSKGDYKRFAGFATKLVDDSIAVLKDNIRNDSDDFEGGPAPYGIIELSDRLGLDVANLKV